ncbi:hypothetical protein MMC10_010494 [Thelotrema lepadinum]|nr:hypothetical protein [Thelotrema lepadinum]
MFSEALVVLAAASSLFSPASGHMIMASPKPFLINGSPVDNSPLSAGGNNFPCKATSPSSYSKTGITNEPMAIGKTQKLSFTGSAIHGGGSCQLALTKDLAPTPSSSWQVILSIEGGCPGVSSPSEFDFSIPQGISPGDYTFAWTWISKLAGQPEYYMNCAPITVTGGSSKRSNENATEIDLTPRDGASFPQLFVANLQSVNSCKTTPSTDPQFPNPGTNVQKPNPAASYAPVAGSGCIPKGTSDSSTGGSSSGGNSTSSGGSGSAPASSAAGSGGASPTSAAGSAPSGGSGSGSSGSSAAGAAPSGSGGSGSSGSGSGSGSGSATTAVASSSVVATPISTPDASAPAAASTPAVSAPAAASTPAASAPAAASTAAAAPPTASGTSSGGGTTGGGLTGPCTSEGMWNCIGGSSFQRCASGQWSTVIPMASGTTCTAGQSQDLAIAKREYQAPRFPGLRRHKEVLKNINV